MMTAAGETTEQHSETAGRAGPGHAVPAQPGSVPEPSRAEPSRAEPSRAEPSRAEPSRAEPSRAEPSQVRPVTGQQRAHAVLAELLDQAAAHNLPAIDWTLTAFEPRLLGRCTAYPGPGRRRADFEAWRALLDADATEERAEERAGEQPVRLTARTERDGGRVIIEIAADLYDDVPDATSPAVSSSSAPGGTWRSP